MIGLAPGKRVSCEITIISLTDIISPVSSGNLIIIGVILPDFVNQHSHAMSIFLSAICVPSFVVQHIPRLRIWALYHNMHIYCISDNYA